MAGTVNDFKIYDEFFITGVTEVITQNVTAFNQASAGSIMLTTQSLLGDFNKESFFKSISALVSRRNPTSTSAATELKLEQDENISVKVDGKVGPVVQALSAMRRIGKDPKEMSYILGQQAAIGMMQDKVNTIISCLVAALSGVSAMVHDYSGTGTATAAGMNQGNAKMGDKSGLIGCYVMHSKNWHDLIGQAISDKVYEVGALAIMKGTTATLGRPTIVIDAPALYVPGTPDKYNMLGLVPGAANVIDSEDYTALLETFGGNENLMARFQAEYSFNVGIKGFKWDTTNGGKSPSNTALATASNWDKTATSNKDLPGVLMISQ